MTLASFPVSFAGDDEFDESEIFWTARQAPRRDSGDLALQDDRKKREFIFSQSQSQMPSRFYFQRTAPINIPKLSNIRKKHAFAGFSDGAEEEQEDDGDQMLPPHEIVSMKIKSTNSVLQGIGRTLKGRDLRQVRNGVWRRTGFLG